MHLPRVCPGVLNYGDTIAIVAPAGPVDKRDALNAAVDSLRRVGFRVRFSERIFQSARYLAGSDEDRAEELMCSFEDPDIKAVLSLRGGYGCARLIPLLDGRRLRSHCKVFMGFSDLTTLHLLFQHEFGWVTFHGPMATSPALGQLTGDPENHLLSLWTDPGYLPRLSFPQLETWFPGVAQGRLVGGCLSLLAASMGTPYEVNTEGGILFLEELGEAPYRIDRMLTHLQLAGKLDHVSGILLGAFSDCAPGQGDYSVEDVLREMLGRLKIPILHGFPAGHGPENWALPLHTQVQIDADARTIQFLEPAVVRGAKP